MIGSVSPRNHPNKTRALILKQVVRARRKHPGRGPHTLQGCLIEQHPDVAWLCPSTWEILKRHGLVRSREGGPHALVWRPPRTRPDRPNRVLTADFKGQFRLGNGTLWYPLTVADALSPLSVGLPGPAQRCSEAGLPEAEFAGDALTDVISLLDGGEQPLQQAWWLIGRDLRIP